MLVSCLDTKKKRKFSTLDEKNRDISLEMTSPSLRRETVISLSPRSQSLASMRWYGRALVILMALSLFAYISLSDSSITESQRNNRSVNNKTSSNQDQMAEEWSASHNHQLLSSTDSVKYNLRRAVPLVAPMKPKSFSIVIVADLDRQSKDETSVTPEFMSYIMHATLKITSSSFDSHLNRDVYSVTFGKETKFTTSMNEAGRGFELSELVWFNGKLLAFDDRTGIVFRLKHFEGGQKTKPLQAIPEHIVMEGDGVASKGQKHEWATVKDGELYMGSIGKEFTDNSGNIAGDENLWIAIMDRVGNIRHEDWTANFAAVRTALECDWPGYVVHEAIEWSPIRRQWFILPRRVSTVMYNNVEDEMRGSNKLIIASEDFSSIQVREAGKVTPLRGFSSFKFIPRSDDSVIVVIKSLEVENEKKQTSFIMVFDLDGNVLMDETEIPGAKKYEGIAFAHDWSSTIPILRL